MTENEARRRWCPFVRVGVGRESGMAAVNRAISRNDSIPDRTRCYASDCMMWRFRPLEECRPDDPRALTPAEVGTDPRYVPHDSPRRFLPRQGYCGLAGAPQ